MDFRPYTPDVSSVLLGISGGVDSSATLVRLQDEGLDLAAVMLLMQTKPISIPDADHLRMAKKICAQRDVPFETINAENPFKEQVRSYFEQTYGEGLTPCPCAVCNQYVKVPLLLHAARQRNIPFVATGHYASLYKNDEGLTFVGRGADSSKDQSYFLSRLTSKQIARLYFPLARESKDNVRTAASVRNLDVANLEESSDICFVAGRNYADILKDSVPSAFKEGNFIDQEGNVLGKHRGIAFYTVGQRKRIGLPRGPWFVKAINEKTNEIVLVKGERPLTTTFRIAQLVLNVDVSYLLDTESHFKVQTHYRSQAVPARFEKTSDGLRVLSEEPLLAASGQVCALYAENVVVGSGFIQKEEQD